MILLLFHLVQVFVWGAYKRPRELTWMTGVLLLGATLGLAFTGYLLPWDEKAYWASKVGLGIVGTVPFIGERLRLLLQGGPDVGNLTLTRFFALHGFVLPGTIIALIVVHLYFFRLHGVTTGWWESEEELERKTEPFWPGQVWKDGVVALGLLVALTAWVCTHPAPLGNVADPSKAYEARPEWYFMFLFQILRYFHGPYEIVGTFVLPSLFFCILFFWPFLDRTPSRDPRRRPFAMAMLGGATIGLVGTTIFAMATDVRMNKPETALQPKVAATPLQKLDVTDLYSTNCLACHAVDGTGNALASPCPRSPTSRTPRGRRPNRTRISSLASRMAKSPPCPVSRTNSMQIRSMRWRIMCGRSGPRSQCQSKHGVLAGASQCNLRELDDEYKWISKAVVLRPGRSRSLIRGGGPFVLR